MREKQQKKKKTETSKKLLYISDAMAGVTLAGTFAAVFYTKDTSPLIYLIPGVFGLASVAHGFYFWKAKAENLHKFGLDRKITMSGGDADETAVDYSGSESGSVG